ncbi:MAG: NAD(P)-dependent oxidoreductase, partial [Microbacterium arborescens]
GAGGIGREVARLLTAVGMTVGLVARTVRETPEGPVAALRDLPALLTEADVFVVALPATAETERIVDARTIAALPPHGLFVNVGRGRTVDERALRAALRDDRLGGAVLDAFEVEPLPADDPLWGDPRVIVSPHTSSRTDGWRDRLAAQFVEQYRAWRAGAPMTALVDKGRGVLMDAGVMLVLAPDGWRQVDPDAALLAGDDLAATRGDGAFESIGVFGGAPLALDPHLHRLHRSMRAVA